MKLPVAPLTYTPAIENQRNREIENADAKNLKRQQNIELASGAKLILHASDGTRWYLTVSTAGAVAATKI